MILRVFLSLLLCITSQCKGVDLLTLAKASAESIQDEDIPSPINLAPGWWNYFADSGDDFDLRAKKVEASLLSKIQNLEGKDRETADVLIKRIDANLTTYGKLRNEVIDEPSPAHEIKEGYSFDEQLEIVNKLSDNTAALNNKKEELTLLSSRLSELTKHFNNQYAQYLEDSRVDAKKFLKGLEIMARKSRLSFLEEQYRLEQKKLLLLQVKQQFYNKELDNSIEQLDIKGINLVDLETELSNVQQQLEQARNNLLLAEENVNLVSGTSPADLSRKELLKQRVVHAFAQQMLATTELMILETQLALVKVIKETEKSVDIANEQSETLENFLEGAELQTSIWKKVSELERDTTGEEAINREEDVDVDPTVLAILQQRHREASATIQTLQRLSNEIFLAQLMNKQLKINFLKKQSYLFTTLNTTIQEWLIITGDFLQRWIYKSLFTVGGVPITPVGIIRAIFIVFLAFWASKMVRIALMRITQQRGKIAEPTIYTLHRLLHYTILIVGIIVAFASIGLTFRNLAIILGALSVGIGFGLQNIVNNFLSGLIILFERNLKIGDYVELETGQWGKIIEINVQNTVIHTTDGIDIFVPNSQVVSSRLVNWTRQDPYQRLHIPFSVAYGTDQDKVNEVVCDAAKQLSTTLTNKPGIPEPETWLVSFGDSSLNFELIVWVNIFRSSGRSSLKASYLSAVEHALKKHHITIPFPQRDLHLKTLPEDLQKFLKPS